MKGKKLYVKPRIECLDVQFGKSLMIAVSGTTTPEESQAKENLWFDDGDEENPWSGYKPDLWDDMD